MPANDPRRRAAPAAVLRPLAALALAPVATTAAGSRKGVLTGANSQGGGTRVSTARLEITTATALGSGLVEVLYDGTLLLLPGPSGMTAANSQQQRPPGAGGRRHRHPWTRASGSPRAAPCTASSTSTAFH